MEMAKYILAILRSQLMIVFSWGFHNPVALNNGLQFQVNGYKHKGKVQVKYDEGSDLFSVILLDRTGKETRKEEGIYLDCLVNVIDRLVEKTDDYSSRVRSQYGL
ncbi:MAG: hypothetical protein IJ202_02465 [Bacteroidales bacterium]|nr:hypothetical protein [Bacteroidales bacterium]